MLFSVVRWHFKWLNSRIFKKNSEEFGSFDIVTTIPVSHWKGNSCCVLVLCKRRVICLGCTGTIGLYNEFMSVVFTFSKSSSVAAAFIVVFNCQCIFKSVLLTRSMSVRLLSATIGQRPSCVVWSKMIINTQL